MNRRGLFGWLAGACALPFVKRPASYVRGKAPINDIRELKEHLVTVEVGPSRTFRYVEGHGWLEELPVVIL